MRTPSSTRRCLCIALATASLATHAFAEGPSKDDAVKMIEKAVAMHKASGKDKTLSAVNQHGGPFHRGELYVFAYDTTGAIVAHPVNPKLVGKNLLEVPDPDGKFYRKTIQELAATKGSGWVDYKYKNPATGRNEPKTTYIQKVEDVIYACGVYR
ncbi:MAG TPA: cache domain-containing protein [Rhizobacter sp.]|nr:cache domain-containing protein [Rhizobacter sp.]